MPARLVVIAGPDRGRVLSVPSEGGLVGRGEACVLRLGDAAVSREHFRIGTRDGRLLVIDLGSTNQTKVNGQPVAQRTVSTGDRIELGGSELEVVDEGDVVCTGVDCRVITDVDAVAAARALGREPADPEFLAGAVAAMTALGEALPGAASGAHAADAAAAVLGHALAASRVQLVRGCDAARGHGFAVFAGRGTDELAPVGLIPIHRAQLVRAAEAGRALAVADGERALLVAPLVIDGAPAALCVDRPGPGWDRAAVDFVAAAARVIGAHLDAHVRRDRVAAERPTEAVEVDGDSAIAARLREWAAWLSQRLDPVLLVGPPGVGKAWLAAVIHGRGARSVAPFVTIPCAAPLERLERELFGREIGPGRRLAGALESARGGTVLLDELTALPASVQARLGRALESGGIETATGGTIPLDVRVIASTCHDLATLVSSGALRDDLFRCVAAQVVQVPLLRERGADVLALAERFLVELGADAGQRRSGFSGQAAARLLRYPWPGNVRELRNVIERVVVRGGSDPVALADVERALGAD